LIGEAVKIANSFVAPVPASEDDGESHAKWTRCFVNRDGQLSKPLLNGDPALKSTQGLPCADSFQFLRKNLV